MELACIKMSTLAIFSKTQSYCVICLLQKNTVGTANRDHECICSTIYEPWNPNDLGKICSKSFSLREGHMNLIFYRNSRPKSLQSIQSIVIQFILMWQKLILYCSKFGDKVSRNFCNEIRPSCYMNYSSCNHEMELVSLDPTKCLFR